MANFYETSPVGNVSQRPFVNTAVKIATTLEPDDLLLVIHQIEKRLHRSRKIHWGPRTLDIDIIFYGQRVVHSDDLEIPHPEAFNRRFVLIPIKELVDHSFPYYEQITRAITHINSKDQELKPVSAKDNRGNIIERATTSILTAIGEDPSRAGLLETPNRVSRMDAEIFSSVGLTDFTDYKLFHSEDSDQSKMIMMNNLPFYSMCEHHMMPFWGSVNVAYMPANGTIIGLSKIPRLIDFVSHKLTLQERLTDEIIDQMTRILAPKGVAVVVDARHMCVEMRGVKSRGAITRTIRFSGDFERNQALQNEFLSAIKVTGKQ